MSEQQIASVLDTVAELLAVGGRGVGGPWGTAAQLVGAGARIASATIKSGFAPEAAIERMGSLALKLDAARAELEREADLASSTTTPVRTSP